jgi:hypothetical protein
MVAALVGAPALTMVASQAADPSPVTAIDILLEPDATMLRHAEAVNASQRKIFPQGFALDATHRPHVTMIQRFVRTADLDQVYDAANKVLARANVTGMKLEAFKYYYIPSKELGLSGIVAKPTPELLKLQADLIAAVVPFTVPSGNSGAFVTTPDDRVIDPFLIEYVSTFVPKSSGEHFNPHVTTGLAPRSYLDKLLAEPFEPFTFSPAGAAVYQLGQFGTAAKKLKEFDLKPRGPFPNPCPLSVDSVANEVFEMCVGGWWHAAHGVHLVLALFSIDALQAIFKAAPVCGMR